MITNAINWDNKGDFYVRIEKLKCLVDIATTGSITNTAQRLYISQQAVSKNIKHLEQELGVDVLVRTKTGVYLTEAGRKVVEFAQKVIAEEEALHQQLDVLKQEEDKQAVHIEICSTSSVTKMVLPDVLVKLQAENENASINLVALNDIDYILQRVASGDCALGMMSINEQELYKKYAEWQNELVWETFVRDEIVVVVDNRYYAHHNIALNETLEKPEQLKTIYNLLPVESMRKTIYDLHIICSADADFHRSMMRQVGSVTIMSALDYQYYFHQKSYRAIRLNYDTPSIVHGVLYRKDAPTDIRRFVSLLRQAMQALQLK